MKDIANYVPPFNNPDYARGFEEGQRHTSPSAETNRRLHELSESMKIIIEMNASIKVMDERTRTILDKFSDYDKRFEKLDGRVGDVEKTQSGLVTKVSIGASLVATVAGAIINKII